MLSAMRARLTYANVTASLALFVALGGISWAAVALPKGSVGSKQLKNSAVTGPKINRNAVSSAKVKDGSLQRGDFASGTLLQGPQGRQGIQGLPGPKGDPGQEGSAVIADGSVTSSKLANSSVTQTKLGLTTSLTQVPFSSINPKAATADCPAGTSLIGGATMVVDSNDLPLNGGAAISYSGPVPIFNPHTWEGAAYRTAAAGSYGLDVIAFCSAA